MKKCENCNLILQDGDAFCPKCGGATVECDSGSHAEGETACNCGENCSCGEENRECGEQTAENVQAGPQMQFVDDGKKKRAKGSYCRNYRGSHRCARRRRGSCLHARFEHPVKAVPYGAGKNVQNRVVGQNNGYGCSQGQNQPVKGIFRPTFRFL